jgi:hypothetical protein
LLLAVVVSTAESATTGANDYIVYTYYSNPHEEWVNEDGDTLKEVINSFDFGPDGKLYYTTYVKNFDATPPYLALEGFAVYCYDGESLEVIYYDPNSFGVSGGRVFTIDDKVYFNDGGNASDRGTFDYYRYDPEASPPVQILDSTDPNAPSMWGLSTWDGTDFLAAGRFGQRPNRVQKIYYSSSINGDLMPVMDLGVASYASGSGPLVRDMANGYLFFCDGGYGATHIWRFDADDVEDAMADPVNDPLTPADAYHFDTIYDGTQGPGAPRGGSSVFVHKKRGLVLTATRFHDPSQLRWYTINPNGTNGGYEVLATSDSRMSETRFVNGEIYVSDPDGIYTLSLIVIDGCDTGVMDQQLGDGELLSEKIDNCAETASNHDQFVSCVARVTKRAKRAGRISRREKAAIQRCAAKANIPANGG